MKEMGFISFSHIGRCWSWTLFLLHGCPFAKNNKCKVAFKISRCSNEKKRKKLAVPIYTLIVELSRISESINNNSNGNNNKQ